MKDKYRKLIDSLEPYIICSPRSSINMKKKILGKRIQPELLFNPLSLDSSSFIEKVFKMDQITFGDQGMGMEKWVFFDCAVMPGFVFGFAIKASDLCDEDRALLGIKSDHEYFPLSMYIAIPTREENTWFGHNLSSLNGKIKKNISGLGLMTKACALDFFDIHDLIGATQWDSLALRIHLKFSGLELLSAYTPIHSKENTLCYKTFNESPLNCLGENDFQSRTSEFHISGKKMELIDLQKRIENGEKIILNNINENMTKFFMQSL